MKGSGGSFQDALGGLFGGVKIGRVKPQLPLKMTIKHLGHTGSYLLWSGSEGTGLSEKQSRTFKDFEDRLVLINTGKIRLSRYRYLMQVIRDL